MTLNQICESAYNFAINRNQIVRSKLHNEVYIKKDQYPLLFDLHDGNEVIQTLSFEIYKMIDGDILIKKRKNAISEHMSLLAIQQSANMTPEQRSERAKKAVQAREAKRRNML